MTFGKGVPETEPAPTFDDFVVGPQNRLAAAAARRAAESPGSAYNPLFLYSASGLGKSHILFAIAHLADERHPERTAMYQTLEGYLDELETAIKTGTEDSIRGRYTGLGLLLLDDVQFIAGHNQAQEALLRTIDALTDKGAQVVLASDRPPAEIDGLDQRLLSRFSSGLIVDIGPPDYETRVAIVRKKADTRGATLLGGVAEAVSRLPLKNVRDLQGALNRVVAAQELEGRPVTPEDIPVLMSTLEEGEGAEAAPRSDAEAETAPAEPAPQKGESWRERMRSAVDEAAAMHVSADRLMRFLEAGVPPDDWQATVGEFTRRLERIRGIRQELADLGDPWPEATAILLTNADRLDEAEGLLASAHELRRPFAPLREGPSLAALKGRYPALALKAAEQLIQGGPSAYNPLFVHSPDAGRSLAFLHAIGRRFREEHPEGTVGIASVPEFAEEFIRAIQRGVSGAWRERWWGVDVLLLGGVEHLSDTERAQEEVFHLFEALTRRGGRIVLAADRAPGKIVGVDERLESRFEGGLVIDLGKEVHQPERRGEPRGEAASRPPARKIEPTPADDEIAKVRDLAGVGRGRWGAPADDSGLGARSGGTSPRGEHPPGRWAPSREKVVWDWPDIEDRIADEQDVGSEEGSRGD